ncbi:RNA methyltransferase [Corynebacterium sp. 153RC1]|uniref:TrmH family RNA methyltransferase n=1 Tax=unclassified Corynebacterium TaxID=2624378 RepID=UPI00211C5463|nr:MULTISPECIES: RNA methyltransferase [unclassified Corynebacterium]MCQ9353363.1 RNA methyltransferase [Corynebacterium sp. 209RC1]MCQ9355534.1 RNA methyltransferase [Corynebacterium sp. 1222RC1]MCQ9357671.1 RNA methyltransferase [Corynebacterium sp. 122RC1]MCQ9359878.1 RNA methyltransferase [Corynebacterium sp. 142RC1]MCQ9362007.1 RNA methyltransferase [Corynebacterium sp. 153RC1]
MISHIEQADAPELADFRDLKHSDTRPDLPGGKGLIIAEGPLVVRRLLESRCQVRSVVGFPQKLENFLAQPGVPELLEGVAVHTVDRPTLAEAAGYDMHRGLLASANRPEPMSVAQAIESARTVAILEGVGDHENIGSMFRNAAGMGVDAILFGNGCADPLYRRVVRVSMGHVLRTPFAHFGGKRTTWQRELAQLQEAGFHLVSLTPNPEVPLLKDALVDAEGRAYEKVALLIGAEGPGLTEHAMRATDIRAQIPMAPGTDSLNLATAAAIAFYERNRSL